MECDHRDDRDGSQPVDVSSVRQGTGRCVSGHVLPSSRLSPHLPPTRHACSEWSCDRSRIANIKQDSPRYLLVRTMCHRPRTAQLTMRRVLLMHTLYQPSLHRRQSLWAIGALVAVVIPTLIAYHPEPSVGFLNQDAAWVGWGFFLLMLARRLSRSRSDPGRWEAMRCSRCTPSFWLRRWHRQLGRTRLGPSRCQLPVRSSVQRSRPPSGARWFG